MTYLLDANGLAALVIPQHEHHARAHRFFGRRPFAITPLTQLALLQILSRPRRVGDKILHRSTLPPRRCA
jgi:predicted nucleic acid-binding protein